MLYDDLVDVPLDVFGGYCPAIVPANLPPGAANVAQDVMFPATGVRTRGGLGAYGFAGAAIPGGASINGLKTYLNASGQPRLMIWDSLGDMFKENPQGTLNLINSRPYQNLFYESQTLFSREYQAFFNSLGGFDIPRQYDDTNWDRVSQVGPGVAPVATDQTPTAYTIAAAGVPGLSVTSQGFTVTYASQVGNIVSLRLNLAPGASLQPGDPILVAGVGVGGYNGTFAVLAVNGLVVQMVNPTSGLAPSSGGTATTYLILVTTTTATPFTAGESVIIASAGLAGYDGLFTVRIVGSSTVFSVGPVGNTALANSGGGTISAVGDVVAGLHEVSVAFVTRQGYITKAAPPSSWTASGQNWASITAIPTGPPNIQARLLLFTPVITAPATTGSFYSLPQGSTEFPSGAAMLIPDNTTTSLIVDFSDAVLIAGFQANYLFNELELGESAFMLGYNSRTLWLGERAKVPNFVNLTFDGGFSGSSPNGWTQVGGGESSAIADVLPVDWGDAYVITGDGVTATLGKITQSAYQDYLKVAIIQSNTSYSVRVRLRYAGTAPTQGAVHINLQSTIGGFTTAGLAVAANTLTTKFQEFTAALTAAPLPSPQTDLLLQVYVDGTLTNGSEIIIDSIEPFPTNTPFNSSIARFSYAFNPEGFDSVTGQVEVRPGDGQQLRAGFPLRNSVYLAKDHYLGYVTDDGVNEPSSWTFTEVSATVGICGPNAVDWTEEWAVFAERSGFYICWGSDPVKLTPEIQSDATFTGRTSWASINWTAASTIVVRIDKVNRMIVVLAPINGATTPNAVFMMDYHWLDTAEDIAASPLVTYSAFTGKILAHGRGRRWVIWNITANSMCFAERADGTAQPFWGNGSTNGLVYWQRDVATQASDNGVAINSQYQGYFMPSPTEEQQYQLRAHRKLAGYLKFRAWGSGTLNLAISTAQRSTLLRGYTLSANPVGDGERPLNLHGERFAVTVGTNAVGSYFQLEKLIVAMKKDSVALVRGMSS
jgi:hypothetical protein